jgi:hypothetical protein
MTNDKPLEYEARVLNVLTEGAYRRHAAKRLIKYQEAQGWVYNEETKRIDPVDEKDGLRLEIFFEVSNKMIAILASDKSEPGISVDDLLILAQADPNKFTEFYQVAIEANPNLTEENPNETKNPNS